jgi:hypothetical protein
MRIITHQNLKTTRTIHYEKTAFKWLLMLSGTSLIPQKRRSKPRLTFAHAKATWVSEVPLVNQIPPLLSLYLSFS